MNDYYYGAGRIRALEAKMITPTQLERMAAAPDFETAWAVLSETIHAEYLPLLKNPFDIDELAEFEVISLKKFMHRIAPENEIIIALLKKHDYLKAKIMLRSGFSQGKQISTGDKKITEATDKAKKLFEQTKDPQIIDITLDKDYYSYLKNVCACSPSPLIKNLVNHWIDLINIKMLLRYQELKQDKNSLKTSLLEPGLIDRDILLNLYDKNIQEINSKLSFTPYFPAIAGGFEYFAQNKSFYLLEKLMDDFVVEQFRKAKYLSSGVEPLVGFYLAREREIKTLRFILICKKNNVGSERIKERLRVSYV